MLDAYEYQAGRARVTAQEAKRMRRRRAISGYHIMETLESRQLMANDPIVVVTGNNLNIGFHDNSPRLADGTDLGTLPSGEISGSTTFTISNGGAGTLLLADVSPVTFTGTHAADFSVNSLTNNSDGTATLVVNFAAAAAGTRNATLHIASNDPKRPDFSFAVRGGLSFTDYATSIGNIRVPVLPVTSDGRVTLTVPVKVTNIGGLAVTGTNSFADVQIYLHDTTTGDETLVTTLAHQNLKGLGLNGSKTFNVKTTLPLGFSGGTYSFVARINGEQAITESNPLNSTPLVNNSAASVATITVAQGHVDLLGSLVSETFPPAVVSDAAFSGKLVVRVTNEGNVSLPSSQKITLQIRANNGTGDVVMATVSNISVGNLKPGKTKDVTININDTGGLPTGTYTIQALITPTTALPEDQTNNNLITQTASGQTFTIVSGASFTNLTGVLAKSTVPLTRLHDTQIKGSLQVTVTNLGNTTLSPGQKLRLEIYANDIPLTVTPLLAAGGLKPGQTRTFTANINVPAGLDAGVYVLKARIDADPSVESDLSDNLITLTGLGVNIPLTIT